MPGRRGSVEPGKEKPMCASEGALAGSVRVGTHTNTKRKLSMVRVKGVKGEWSEWTRHRRGKDGWVTGAKQGARQGEKIRKVSR